MRIGKLLVGTAVSFAALAAGGMLRAQDGLDGLERIGKPTPGGTSLQPAATEVARDIHFLDNMILWIITGITLLVMVLLLWVIIRYNSRVNKTPATFTHNSVVEVLWTLGPIVILIFIGAFSLPVLFKQLEIPKADLTIKVTGNQWFWNYEYPDQNISFDSYMIGQPATLDGDQAYVLNDEVKAKLKAEGYNQDEFLLAVDNPLVVPVGKYVVLDVTSADVIHAFAVPAFGVKMDAIPGRTNRTWFKADKIGMYFGQCSQLCGKDHAFMPIVVKVVSQDAYEKWLGRARAQFAEAPVTRKPGKLTVASR